MAAPAELLEQVPLFADLDKREMQGLASSMKERIFSPGDQITTEGKAGVGFFVIEDGEATVSVGGEELRTIKGGDYFGEIALIDDSPRTATITAKTELKTYGITSWEFRPLVEQNADLAWKMLKMMAKQLREAQERG